jgi:uncharacterized repeat protein (TIGR03803 family)
MIRCLTTGIAILGLGTFGLRGSDGTGPPAGASGRWEVRTIHAFRSEEGVFPVSPLVLGGDGMWYGRLGFGGALGGGAIYRVSSNGLFAVVYAIPKVYEMSEAEGALVFGKDGTMFGALGERIIVKSLSKAEPTPSPGLIFALSTNGQLRVRHRMRTEEEGARVRGPIVVEPNGSLVCAANFGGKCGFGSLFRLETNGTVRVLHSFRGGADARLVKSGLVADAHGVIYGTSECGGRWGGGTLFAWSDAAGFRVLHDFQGNGTTSGQALRNADIAIGGENPRARLIVGSDGSIVGSACRSAVRKSGGSIFRWLATKGFEEVTTLPLEFSNFSDFGGFVQGADGRLYGGVMAVYTGTRYLMAKGKPVSAIVEIATDGKVEVLTSIKDEAALDKMMTIRYGIVEVAPGVLMGLACGWDETQFGSIFLATRR